MSHTGPPLETAPAWALSRITELETEVRGLRRQLAIVTMDDCEWCGERDGDCDCAENICLGCDSPEEFCE